MGTSIQGLLTEARNLVGKVHAEAEPLVLQNSEFAVAFHRRDTTVHEVGNLGVFLAEGVTMPIVAAHILHHGERARLVPPSTLPCASAR